MLADVPAENSPATIGHLAGSATPTLSARQRRSAYGTGVGTALAEEFFAWARESGANQVSVTAYSANESAVSFYRGLGFTPFELTLHAPI